MDDTSRARGHPYTKLATNSGEAPCSASSGRDAAAVQAIAADLAKHGMCSKVEPTKEVAALVRRQHEDIVARATARQTNGFLETLNELFRAAMRRARGFGGFGGFDAIQTIIFLIASKLDFGAVRPSCPGIHSKFNRAGLCQRGHGSA